MGDVLHQNYCPGRASQSCLQRAASLSVARLAFAASRCAFKGEHRQRAWAWPLTTDPFLQLGDFPPVCCAFAVGAGAAGGASGSAGGSAAAPAAARPAGVDLQKHPSGIVPKLQNLVATVNMACKLDLRKIAMTVRAPPATLRLCIARVRRS